GAVYPVVTRGETFLGEAVILGLPYYTIYEPIFDAAGKVLGILYAGVQKDRLAGRLSEMRVATGIAALAAILLAALSGLWGFRRLLRPVPALSAVMEKLAADETDVEVPYTGREDEVGAMARTVQVFRDNAVERARLQSTSEDERRAREERQKRIESLIAGFRGSVADMLQQVGSATGEMEQTAQALSGIADDTNGRASAATSASEEASSNVQTVASAAEELASSIGEINRQVSQASDIVRHASQNTEATNDKVSGLAAAAQKIGDVVSLIQDIAEQTNLLALNATIEAARAGEMGKGFAVVASEVKSLANQTARATEDISAQIAAIQSSTGEIARTMAEVDQYTSAIAASVEEQGAATAEISRNAQEAAAGTQDVAQNVAGVTAAAGETQQTAGQVSAATAQLAAQAARLREEIDTFLNEVAAA
ncbi:MAG: methyl-accepting chemotaxis protein, partial [Flavobacteriaceae bacterium]